MKPLAFSLIRFSTPGQADGDSYRRQFSPQQSFCDKRAWELDLSLHHNTLRKFAVSGSKDVKKTPFYKYVMMVEAGALPAGRQLVLLAEDIDRMTRGIHDQVYDLCLRLMRAGCWLCTTMDGEVYTLDKINDPDSGKRDKLLRKLDAAADYSVKLGTRVSESWVARRERAASGQPVATKNALEWLDVINPVFGANGRRLSGEFAINPVRGATVQLIHRLCRDGYGKRQIAVMLNSQLETHPAWRGKTWHPSAVQRVLEQRGVFGECTMYRQEKDPAGKIARIPVQTIANYYPAVLTETEFYLAEAARKSRAHKGPLHKHGKVNNLFSGIAQCACGGTLVYQNKSRGNEYLVCDNALRHVPLAAGGVCQHRRHHNYPALESALLDMLPLFDLSRLIRQPDTNGAEITALEAMIAEKTERLARLAEFDDMGPEFAPTVRKIKGEISEAREKLATLRKASHIRDAQQDRDTFAEFSALVMGMRASDPNSPERALIRGSLAQEFRRVIGRIAVEGDDLVVWLPDTPQYRVGFRMVGSQLATVVFESAVFGRYSEYPVQNTDTAELIGSLEQYVNGTALATFEAELRANAARIAA